MKPRVLLLIKTLGRGGAERLLLDSLKHADHEHFQYEVAYLVRDAPYRDDVRERGVAATWIGGRSPFCWPIRLRRLVRSGRIDVIHAHSPVMAVGARLVTRVPIVYTEHNTWPSYRRLTRWGNWATFGLNSHAFAVAEQVRRSIRRRRPKSETLRYGIDLGAVEHWRADPIDVRKEFGIPDNAPVIVTVANLRPQKGHEVLLQAAEQVRREVPATRFVLVGDGPLRGRLETNARDLGISDAVVFAGYREDAPRLVAGADVFVLPSFFEGLSIALLEAMAVGRAVAVTRAGGNVEVVEHETNALVVDPGDSVGLADAVTRLLQDERLRQRLGAAAEIRAQTFDIRNAVARQETVYRHLLSQDALARSVPGETGKGKSSSQRSA